MEKEGVVAGNKVVQYWLLRRLDRGESRILV